jgi:hypothetical protein
LETERGKELLKEIVGPWYWHGDPQTVVIKPGIGYDTGALFKGKTSTDTIQVDPDFHPVIKTEDGLIRASDQRIIGHELGHSVTGTLDEGTNKMDNVKQNENPIATQLGLSPRTQYLAPENVPSNVPQEIVKSCMPSKCKR